MHSILWWSIDALFGSLISCLRYWLLQSHKRRFLIHTCDTSKSPSASARELSHCVLELAGILRLSLVVTLLQASGPKKPSQNPIVSDFVVGQSHHERTKVG
jgi:hypothetical protein